MKGLLGVGKEVTWGDMARRALCVFLTGFLLLAGFVILIDPYDTVPFSLPLDRAPASTNQRFSYPAVAMDPTFDSLVVGTSVVRLLKPSELEATLGGRFANLAMNSAMPYEQSQILQLFLRNRKDVKTVIFGIDTVWCGQKASPKLTSRPFPPWLYDGNRWNDALHLLNLEALEQAGRQLGQLMGVREEKYQRNGYANFLPPRSEYDLQKVRKNLYQDGKPAVLPPGTPPADNNAAFRESLVFPDLEILRGMVAALPQATRKIFLGAPVHAITIGSPGSRAEAIWQECMSRIAQIGAEYGNAYVLDFKLRSDITVTDRNYWDPLHFRTDTASRIVRLVGEGVMAGRSTNPAFRYVTP
ncbi:hypothetical protein EOI86_04150 [Hwanghaeella grinnelliae]|uniref:Uncharacterized protein n=1 Tax=Hwanghaeella grinnelliae TaxID=2500179 RepID=A0A3S2Z9E9_9PROT|nr:hypothetical protein [Hwanghaeella grinnelliae]RVU38483.1 hypothetical protein EOI86_04150 [Hwanghaeella grinnelliae]